MSPLRDIRIRKFGTLLLAVTLVGLLVTPAVGQFYFGKNKVQYASFDWQVMTTEHFRIYFYVDEGSVARVAARIAEDAYAPLAAKFNHEITRKIPLIIYSSPGHFAQTNVVTQLLPESVGGFTEFLKGRVVVPFYGSYYDFVHVIRHELVHVFMFSKLAERMERQSRPRYLYPPLWFTEGIAEYWSEGWDTEADLIIKDMVIRGGLLPISEFWTVRGSYFMYKLGQSVCMFINDEYGPDKLTRLFDNWTKGRTFDEVVRYTLGDGLHELSAKWEYAQKKRYYPQMAELGLPEMESDRLTYDGYCVKGVPVTWDDGHGTKEWLVFMAYRRGYTGIYLKPRRPNGKGLRTLIKGERSSRFESLYLLRSGIDATNSGLIVFSSKSKARDVLYVYDLNCSRVTDSYRIEDLVAARSPRFSPDERQVVFSGIRKSGQADIFLLHLETGKYEAITEDIYNDIDPAFSTDGSRIVFSSDQGAHGEEGAVNLFEIDLRNGRRVKQLTFGNFRDETPEVTEHGIFFSSDRLGSYNLFLLDSSGQITRQSTYVTGAHDPRLSSDGSELIYSGYQDMQYHVYSMKLIADPQPLATVAPDSGSVCWYPRQIDGKTARASIRYDTDYSFDIAQSMITYDPIYGSMGGVQAAVSDILGNHAYYFLVANTAESKDEILSSFNVAVSYLNREKRMNWGAGLFHLYDEYYNDHDQYFYKRQAGVVGMFSYPVSKFDRFDLNTYVRYEKKDLRYGQEDREGFLVTGLLSWVYDNSIWDISGPIEGRRYNFSAGVTYSLDEGRSWNRLAFADVRHYFRLGRYSALANRLFAYSSAGYDPQRIYFGGSWSFRGFGRRHFYNRNVLFASNELRFPLIDALLIGFPIGGLDFRGIRGAMFFDVGNAWDDDFDRFLGSFGAGVRVNLGYVVQLRFDFTRTTDFETVSPKFDFDFFFGWNF